MRKCAQSTSVCLGVRICGMQVGGRGLLQGWVFWYVRCGVRMFFIQILLFLESFSFWGSNRGGGQVQFFSRDMYILVYDTLGFLKSIFQGSGVRNLLFFNWVLGFLVVVIFYSGYVGFVYVGSRFLMIVCEQALGKELREGIFLRILWIFQFFE